MGSLGYSYSKLVNLDLAVSEETSESFSTVAEQLLRFCPNLEILKLAGFANSLQKRIPHILTRLRYLNFNACDEEAPEPISMRSQATAHLEQAVSSNGGNGIEKLLAFSSNGEDTVPLIQAYRTSIQVMDLYMTKYRRTWNSFSQIGILDKLWYLGIYQWKDDGSSVIAALARQCPNLMRLELETGILGQHACTAIAKLDNLTYLRLCDIQNTNASYLLTILRGIASRSRGIKKTRRAPKTLETIHLDGTPSTTDDVLQAVSEIATLRAIRIMPGSDINRSLTERGITQFFQNLQSHPSIKRLDLMGIEQVTSSNFKYLRGIKSLKHLGILDLNNINLPDIKGFSSELVWSVSSCFGDEDEDGLEYLDTLRHDDHEELYFRYPTSL